MRVSILGEPFITGMRQVLVPADAWQELSSCLLCGESIGLRDTGWVEGTQKAAVVSLCLHCTHGFLRRRPKASWYESFYATDWDQAGQQSMGTFPLHVTAVPKIYDYCQEFLSREARVLDIGAGFGKTLLAFKEHGHPVYAVEPSQHRRGYLEDTLGIPCAESLAAVPASERIDLVTINHVLEHVLTPAEMIADVYKCLSAKGMLYIAVPNFWLEYPLQSFHFVPHVSLFTLRSLEQLLIRSGFHIAKSHAGKELQVLAMKEKAATNHAQAEEPDFEARASRYFLSAFGPATRKRGIILWHLSRGNKTYYETHFLPFRSWLPRVLTKIIKRRNLLPSTIHRRFPFGLGGWMPRMATIEQDGNRSLPIVVHHDSPGAPVWVK